LIAECEGTHTHNLAKFNILRLALNSSLRPHSRFRERTQIPGASR